MRFLNFILLLLSVLDVIIAILIRIFFILLKIIIRKNKSELSNSILVIRIDHKIGDMVIFSDFIRKLSIAHDRKPITLIIHSSQKDLYNACPYVNEIYYFDWGLSLPLSLPFRSIRILLFLVKNKLIRNWAIGITSRYDEDLFAPFILYLSGSQVRIGYSSFIKNSRKKFSMFLTDFFYTKTVFDHDAMHESSSNLAVLEVLNINYDKKVFYETWQKWQDYQNAQNILDNNNVSINYKVLSLGIGAYSKKRIWPAENFATLINMIGNSDAGPFKFLILGSKHDKLNAISIIKNLSINVRQDVIDLTGATSIMETCALLNYSDIFVGNDSGLMHLACANTEKVIEISCHPLQADNFGANSPVRFGPIANFTKIFQPEKPLGHCANGCSSNTAHCISSIEPESVSAYIISYINKNV